MTAELFRDVPDALTELRLAGVKTYIYSSGSREAQRLFFGHCQVTGGSCSSGTVRWLRRQAGYGWLFARPPPGSLTPNDDSYGLHSSNTARTPLTLSLSFVPPFTQVGDLRPYLSGFFDTSSGPKLEARSYRDIALSLGVDSASEILFATDVLGEALAAKAAGWQAVLVSRPGNKPLAAGHGFREITTMKDLVPGL